MSFIIFILKENNSSFILVICDNQIKLMSCIYQTVPNSFKLIMYTNQFKEFLEKLDESIISLSWLIFLIFQQRNFVWIILQIETLIALGKKVINKLLLQGIKKTQQTFSW